ncbi:penicillin-binding protein 2 [Sinimarinibacterium sp. CAU 1509]|uniref:peptidoglycan D,D-transpeptidase FtsI family protein n=1 Tax=Sinimarinibacterium sp. CAU 1509 TaxID=2562283 RepID=UPI0010AD3770|nr:penicillin-binding protein 2 [Sinimarinibacterium sp. CAU 1509]TJY65156.1 penicillin-binding protein 2 [Sinimarinibacterium sp. CAU 1509]
MTAVRNRSATPVGAWRSAAVLGLLALGAVVVLGRAFQLQILERDFLTGEGNKRHIRTMEIPAHRGAIVDRRGEPLALSAPVESIWVVPSALLESPAHVTALAKLLNRQPGEFSKYLTARKDRRFVYVSDPLSPAEAQRVLSLKAPGVFSEPSYARYYPAGEIAGQLVGFCGRDGNGLEGIEKAQESLLAGHAGERRVIRDRAGRVVEDSGEYREAEPGDDVALTIDLRVQYLAYRELKNAVAKNKAKGGVIVIADSSTGEILAIASQPGFNPNNPAERASKGTRNRAIVDSFEPGSTVKPLLVSQALELGAFQPGSLIDTTPGVFKVGALTVRDVHPQGVVDLTTLLSKSSNVGAAKIGMTIGAEAVWSGYQRFGFGEPVYTGFPGEATPVLRNFKEWGQIATATASYGYGFSLNALHLVRAYAALANDGLMSQLKLIRDGRTLPPQRAVSANTARAVRHMLEHVVAPTGTARRAAVAGYRVAGKTGTVRKVAETGGYAGNKHQALFVGMVPVEHPRLVGLVMIDEPSADGYYGGLVAAPVFASVMQGAARLLQIPPGDDAPTVPEPAARTVALPQVATAGRPQT